MSVVILVWVAPSSVFGDRLVGDQAYIEFCRGLATEDRGSFRVFGHWGPVPA